VRMPHQDISAKILKNKPERVRLAERNKFLIYLLNIRNYLSLRPVLKNKQRACSSGG